MFARVGRSGLAAIKDRQYDHKTNATLELASAFDLLEDLFQVAAKKRILAHWKFVFKDPGGIRCSLRKWHRH